MRETSNLPHTTDLPPLERLDTTALRVNLGASRIHNNQPHQANARPCHTEPMGEDVITLLFQLLTKRVVGSIDLGGEMPEIHPRFADLVEHATACGVAITDHCNLTVLEEPGYEYLYDFLEAHEVRIVAPLPGGPLHNAEHPRSDSAFKKSILALRTLSRCGYGDGVSGLKLDLTYIPTGQELPHPQIELERRLKKELFSNYGINFDRLLAVINMPIPPCGEMLDAGGPFGVYISLLWSAHQGEHLKALMCRQALSVDCRGYLYDCDYDQMLGRPLQTLTGRAHLRHLLDGPLSRISN